MKIILVLFLTSLSLSSYAATQFKFSKDKGSIDGVAIGQPKALRIEIKGTGPSGDLVFKDKKLTGLLAVDLSDLKTGVDMRDRHMKEKYLEVEKYKTATLNVKEVSLPENWNPKTKLDKTKFNGELTLHGEKKDIEGTFDYKPSGDEAEVTATFDVIISDHKIDTPEFLKIKVTDKVEMKTTSHVQVTEAK